MEDEEALETRAVVCNPSDLVQNLVNQLLADRVVTTSVVVGSILLASDHLLGVEQTAVGTSADLVNNVGLEIAVDGAGDVFAVALLSLLAFRLWYNIWCDKGCIPVSEKKVENPWSSSAALRSSVRYPSGCDVSVNDIAHAGVH